MATITYRGRNILKKKIISIENTVILYKRIITTWAEIFSPKCSCFTTPTIYYGCFFLKTLNNNVYIGDQYGKYFNF